MSMVRGLVLSLAILIPMSSKAVTIDDITFDDAMFYKLRYIEPAFGITYKNEEPEVLCSEKSYSREVQKDPESGAEYKAYCLYQVCENKRAAHIVENTQCVRVYTVNDNDTSN